MKGAHKPTMKEDNDESTSRKWDQPTVDEKVSFILGFITGMALTAIVASWVGILLSK